MIGKLLFAGAGAVTGALLEARFRVVGWTTEKIKSLLKKEQTTETKAKK